MATYTITTTRKQEAGLKYAYDTYADKTQYTQAQYFQLRIDQQVTDPMYNDYQRSQAISFDKSFNTIPETDQPKAKTEIEAVIVSNGGEILPAVDPMPPMPPPGDLKNEPTDGTKTS